MKKNSTLFSLLLLISTVFISNQLHAQAFCQWDKTAGGTDEDYGSAMATDLNGNVYALGGFYSQTAKFGTVTLKNPYNTYNEGTMYLVKYDSCGNLLWDRTAGGDNDTHGRAIATDAAGNVYVTGYSLADTLYFGTTKLINTSSRQAFIVKYDPSGNVLWARQGSGNGDNLAYSIAVDATNNVYVAGAFTSATLTFGSGTALNGSGGSNDNVFVVKYDGSGNFQWLASSHDGFSSSGGDVDALAFGIGTDANGNVYVGGGFTADYIRFGTDSAKSTNSNGYNDIFIIKYNTSGTLQWIKVAGSDGDDVALSLAADANGNSYIAGYLGSSVSFGTHAVTTSAYGTTAFIAKYDATGAPQWAKGCTGDPNPNASTDNEAYHVCLDANGNPSIIGFYTSDSLKLAPLTLYNNSITSGSGGGDYLYDIFVASYKAATGSLSWARTAGGDSSDYGYGIAAGKHNTVYITGEYASPVLHIADSSLTLTKSSLAQTADIFIANNISMSSEQALICEVTTDSLSINNIVVWDKTPYTDVASFIIYRETSTNVYTKIALQPYSALSQFIDTARSVVGTFSVSGANGNPNVTSYKYKLQTIDTSGNYGQMSPYHETIYFTNSGNGTFNWNLYTVENAVTPVSLFTLQKDANNTGNWVQVGSASGTAQTLNDPTYTATPNPNYRVDPIGFSCTPTFRLAGGNNNPFAAKVKSHSNQSNNKNAGINKVSGAGYQIAVYPNPNNGSFIIETSSAEKQNLQVFDVNGKLVLSQTIDNKTTIDASTLSEGVYNLSVIGNEGVVNKKMVIVR